jgi:hypothetical protein
MKIVLECISVHKQADGRFRFEMLPLYPSGEQIEALPVVGTVEGVSPVPGRFYDLMLNGVFVQDSDSRSCACEVTTFESKKVLKGIANQEWCDRLEQSRRK